MPFKIGQEVFVVFGGGKRTFTATLTRVGRKYGEATTNGKYPIVIEFLLETGHERNFRSFDHDKSHAIYSTEAEWDEVKRKRDAIAELGSFLNVTVYNIRNLRLSSECIDELVLVLKKHVKK